jgi:hypothetical protein
MLIECGVIVGGEVGDGDEANGGSKKEFEHSSHLGNEFN